MRARCRLCGIKKRLIKASEARAVQAEGTARNVGLARNSAEQTGASPSRGDGTIKRERREQDGLPLVVVPFEAVPEEEQLARRKYAVNVRRSEARLVAFDLIGAAPERLGLTLGETSGGVEGQVEEESSDSSQPYVPEWPHVTKGSTLASAEAKLEWLQNCVPLNVLDGYKKMGGQFRSWPRRAISVDGSNRGNASGAGNDKAGSLFKGI